ncbi:glyoxylase-like metal-dependent hydrolase (beta-lactamase superfamily II) [Sinobacterium caligoides]|uniref:Glyoxylase-like metal-dependent hydrolase (Beta-lactamase superfamily II) n=1 Tax=Sinobacterium caligoides TaxID=933926 RepID=A0A3N2DXV4_9GAMM|nr:MBL fold metallo-hydrolase [Sinobacterium caligoides]ROS04648.1 glyoxylase-like metal-dependent hydrolase (beta-lactamase superfamily II) [Sinobacterium caligoides]
MREITMPFKNPPDFGEVCEVAPGVLWARMPLPLALNHINVYLVDAGDGWMLIDTGMKGEQTREYWRQIIDTQLSGRPIVGVVCTHMHPDHVGLAGWLVDTYRVPLYMTMAEFFQAAVFSRPLQGHEVAALGWRAEQYFSRSGLSESMIAQVVKGMGGFAAAVESMPRSYTRLVDGERMQWGKHEWQVIVGRGHSPEHACLYCRDLGVMLAGDQIIADITPNVSVSAVEPEGQPLQHWLASIERFKLLDDDILLLPAHKLPFYGLHRRLFQLQQHHENHLKAILAATATAKTALELLPVLFKRELPPGVLTLALGECIAHLHELIRRGVMERQLVEGVYAYRSLLSQNKAQNNQQPDGYIAV